MAPCSVVNISLVSLQEALTAVLYSPHIPYCLFGFRIVTTSVAHALDLTDVRIPLFTGLSICFFTELQIPYMKGRALKYFRCDEIISLLSPFLGQERHQQLLEIFWKSLFSTGASSGAHF